MQMFQWTAGVILAAKCAFGGARPPQRRPGRQSVSAARRFAARGPRLRVPSVVLCVTLITWADPAIHADSIPIRDWLVLESPGKAGRNATFTDALLANWSVGADLDPHATDSLALPDGTSRTWRSATPDDDGALRDDALRGGYAWARVESRDACVMLLSAAGHNMVYVNGEPRVGDPYSLGYVQIPVALRAGANTLLFQVGRGTLRATLQAIPKPVQFCGDDLTLPDIWEGDREVVVGVRVINADDTPLSGAVVEVERDGAKANSQPAPTIPALSLRKIPVVIPVDAGAATGAHSVTLRIRPSSANVALDELKIELLRKENGPRRRTFVSNIDASVQYYAVLQARDAEQRATAEATRGLLLSLHGASVEALNQAASYGPRSALDIVAPTNRRPYGFDWEDWGRADAVEVLDDYLARYGAARGIAPDRRYLTGHSMGGHGTWHLGVTFPDRFACIGPSAGWISFFSYGNAERVQSESLAARLLARCTNASDTLALLPNLAPLGVYILHGDADDNVPVTQAREMREKLATFHRNFDWHEQPGAGHWWGSSDEPGEECLDWPPMMDFFARHRLAADADVREISFRTASPGVSADCHWLTIHAQQRALEVSHVAVRCEPNQGRFFGKTENVLRLGLDAASVCRSNVATIELDGQVLGPIPLPSTQIGKTSASAPALAARHGSAKRELIWLERRGDSWRVSGPPPMSHKHPARCGPFKEAFRNRFLLVYGTSGDAAENLWARNKARFDAEMWWYRGNGATDVLSDRDYLALATGKDSAMFRDRNVILYGHRECNAAWTHLLASSPIQVERGGVRIGQRTVRGDDLACLFVRPKSDSDSASVGVVATSGAAAQRMAERMPYFISGVAYPDFIVISADMLRTGVDGIRAAGFFGDDWGLETGECAFSREGD